MTTTTGSAHYAGLLPVEPRDEPPSIRPTTLENDRFRNGQPSLRKQASRAIPRFLITFCSGVAATVAWQWYGDAAREMIARSYPQLGWPGPRPLPTGQNAPGISGLAAPAAPFDQQQLNAVLDAMRQSIDRLVAGHELILRSIDQIATRVITDHEQMTHNTDQTATNIAAGQKQIAGSIDQTATNSAQDLPAKASGITVESRTGGASLQPIVRLDIKPTEARAPQTLPERGKQLSAASGHDASCFPSASAVLQNHPRGWPTWTLRAPGHEGTLCWYAAARPRGSDHRPRASDHRRETTPGKEVGTTENGLFAPSAPRGSAEGSDAGLP
jgi:hypothetical protein